MGLHFLMATTSGHSKSEFFDMKKIDRRFYGAPFTLCDLMSVSRFDLISKKLKYTSQASPSYHDGFHPIRELTDEWNKNMADVFVPGWMLCLDESMQKWLAAYTCPGFVFCPRKPWPFGNEWHTIACVQSSIIFHAEIVDGKD